MKNLIKKYNKNKKSCIKFYFKIKNLSRKNLKIQMRDMKNMIFFFNFQIRKKKRCIHGEVRFGKCFYNISF